jgi:hypothetical protein
VALEHECARARAEAQAAHMECDRLRQSCAEAWKFAHTMAKVGITKREI